MVWELVIGHCFVAWFQVPFSNHLLEEEIACCFVALLVFCVFLTMPLGMLYDFGNSWSYSNVVCICLHDTRPSDSVLHHNNCAATCDFQKCGILTSVDSDEPVQPHFKLRRSK